MPVSTTAAKRRTAATFHRYVALGDSFTEGVGDPDPARPNGVRGWADRVAEQLSRHAGGDFGYANLAIRGRKLQGVLDEQIEPGLALDPDLITIYAGANDILRPTVDLDALAARYEEAVARMARSGATLGIFTAFDPGREGLLAKLRGRLAIYNELVREIADRHGAIILDSWRMRPADPPSMWSPDRLHLGPRGHLYVATQVLDTLQVPHELEMGPAPEAPVRTARETRAENLAWARTHAAPWVQRRLTGRSSGDSISPKRPALEPISPR